MPTSCNWKKKKTHWVEPCKYEQLIVYFNKARKKKTKGKKEAVASWNAEYLERSAGMVVISGEADAMSVTMLD